MKIVIQHAGVPSSQSLDGAIERHLFSLAGLIRIDEANVIVERRWSGGAAYRVFAHIVTLGQDVKAEGIDQTANAAVLKFARDLADKVRARLGRMSSRVRTGPQKRSVRPGRRA
jgi:hypothetical protein